MADVKNTGINTTPTGKNNMPIPKDNYKYMIIGLAIIILGFILMSGGGNSDPNTFNENELFSFRRITLAPIIVVLGFVVEGWAIMKKPKSDKA